MTHQSITRLVSSLGLVIFIFCNAHAEKIDDYNYRMAIMDDFTIYDSKAQQIYNENRLDLLVNPPVWKLYDDNLNILESDKFSAKVQCLKPAEPARIWHNFYQGIDGVSHFTSLCFKIEIVAPTGVEFTSDFPTSIQLGGSTYIGDSHNLTGPTLPEYNDSKAGIRYEYKSSNPDVISVGSTVTSNGRIWAKSIGKATITVTAKAYNDRYNNSYIIGSDSRIIEVVESTPCESIIFNSDPVFIKRPADPQSLIVRNIVEITPADVDLGLLGILINGQEEKIYPEFYLLNEEKPNVYKIKFWIPYGEETTAVMRADNGVEGQFRVLVYDPVESITLDKTDVDLPLGKEIQLSATVLPENATYKDLTWTSEDETIATVSDTGLVKALKKGNVRITVTSDVDEISAYCDLTVIQPVEAIYLSKSEINIKPGEFETLTAYVSPENADNKALKWKSGDEKVAKVENGTVMGISDGKTVVRAIAADDSGVSAECAVNVGASSEIEDVVTDETAYVKIFNLQGLLIYEGSFADAHLVPDYYIVVCDGKKVKVRIE